MGKFSDYIARYAKMLFNRYNTEERTYKLLDKGNLPAAPRHPAFEKAVDKILEEKPELKTHLKHLHEKNEKLTEYLKKVYLTSTSEVTGTESKRPKLNKYLKPLEMMYFEPKKPSAGHCTFTNLMEILVRFQEDSDYWNASAIARHYNLDKATVAEVANGRKKYRKENIALLVKVRQEIRKQKKYSKVNLLMYYSLFRNDKFEFMNQEAEPMPDDKKEVIEFKVLADPEKEAKQIEAKKD